MPRQAQRVCVVACVCLAIGMAAGLAAIAFAVGATPARNVVLSVSVVCGILAAVATDLPRIVVVALAAVAGVAIGLDSPPETVSRRSATSCWRALGLEPAWRSVSWAPRQRLCIAHGQIGLRVLGSWVAASALLGLALRLVR